MTLSYVLALLTPYYTKKFIIKLFLTDKKKKKKKLVAKENAKKTPTRADLMQPRTLRD
jgi:hypothetical protein